MQQRNLSSTTKQEGHQQHKRTRRRRTSYDRRTGQSATCHRNETSFTDRPSKPSVIQAPTSPPTDKPSFRAPPERSSCLSGYWLLLFLQWLVCQALPPQSIRLVPFPTSVSPPFVLPNVSIPTNSRWSHRSLRKTFDSHRCRTTRAFSPRHPSFQPPSPPTSTVLPNRWCEPSERNSARRTTCWRATFSPTHRSQ